MTTATQEDSVPAYQQIERRLRDAILSGELAYGERLPAMQTLAAQHETSIFTIQTALAPLVKEGLLESSRRRGTFVRGRPDELRSVGIYFGNNFWAGSEMAYYRELFQELSRELRLGGTKQNFWIDSRLESEQKEPLPDLVTAVKNREVQGLIVSLVNPVDMKWLQSLGIPLAAATTHPIAARVGPDWRQFVTTGLQELKRQGCASAGLIVPWPVWGPKQSDQVEDIVRVVPEFLDAAGDVGFKIRDEWVRTPVARLTAHGFKEYGYREFLAVSKLRDRPDGLLVYPDIVADGATTAILQTGISVPRDLKLVFHRNEGVDLLCPLPVSWLVTSVRQIALALVGQLKRQLAGKGVQPVYLPYALESVQSPA